MSWKVVVPLVIALLEALPLPVRACMEGLRANGADEVTVEHAARAQCAVDVGDYEAALDAYRALYASIDGARGRVLVLANIARTLERLGRDEEALDAYRHSWRELPVRYRRADVGRSVRDRARRVRERLDARYLLQVSVPFAAATAGAALGAVITGALSLALHGPTAPMCEVGCRGDVADAHRLALATDGLLITGAVLLVGAIIAVMTRLRAEGAQVSFDELAVRF